jgi:hypothetical protein
MERFEPPENQAESGKSIFRAAQEVNDDEKTNLENKLARYKSLEHMAFGVAVPGSLWIIAKQFGIDIEQVTGIPISEHSELLKYSFSFGLLGATAAHHLQGRLQEKLNSLRKK